MILDRITLYNFGPYLGRQTIELTPPSPERPVILIGALNGGGKTSLLDALQLCLYGTIARCSKRGSQRYDEYLRSCIHRRADPKQGAEIALTFRHRSEGRERSYRVHRMWASTGKGLREHLEVYLDELLDEALTATWPEHVERFLPSRLAPLFFFDGEQIESLADPEHAAGALKTAVHALLGLDLVDQLQADLLVLQRKRQRESSSDPKDQQALIAVETEIARLQGEGDVLRQQTAALRNDLDRAEEELAQAERRFREHGGGVYEQRRELEQRLVQVHERIAGLEGRLRELAAGNAPLLLVRDLLANVLAQHQREQAAEQSEAVGTLLHERDGELLALLEQQALAPTALDAARSHLERDRQARQAAGITERYLHLSPAGGAQIQALLADGLPQAERELRQTLEHLERDQRDEQMIERQLAAIPEGAAIEALVSEREVAQRQVADLQARIATANARIAAIAGEQERSEKRRDELLRTVKRSDLEARDVTRFCQHTEQASTALSRFRAALLRRHVQQVEKLILESFQHLLRKSGLVRGLSIDIDTWALRLQGENGIPLPAGDLSAGERQLLAVSILWGLARASGRVLPVVVDTPLGRLDGQHRMHLVQRYFPHASHQVILLSTDKEIDYELRAELQRRTGRTLLLEYDAEQDATVVNEGYFGVTT